MKIKVGFTDQSMIFTPQISEVHVVTDGGYERGYSEGYEKGTDDGYAKGYSDGETNGYSAGYIKGEESGYVKGREKGYNEGLSARTYETWTITLVDETIVEKEVALL